MLHRVGYLLAALTATYCCLVCGDARATEQASLAVLVTVETPAGEPAPDVEVTTHASAGHGSETYRTDDQGRVALELDPKSSRGLMLTADNGQDLGLAQLPWSEQELAVTESVTIQLGPAREFDVTVVDQNDAPVAGADVLLQSGFRVPSRTVTDEAGEAVLRVPSETAVQAIVARKSGAGLDYYAFAPEGAPRQSPDMLRQNHHGSLRLVLNGVRRVTVEVVDQAGEALAGVTVTPWLLRKRGKGEELNIGGQPGFTFETDGKGRCTFEVPIDQDRATTVWTRLKGYAAPERLTYDPKAIDTLLRATLEQMVKFSGHVETPDGVQPQDVRVVVSGAGHSFDDFRGSAELDDRGNFELLANRNMYYQAVARTERDWVSPPVNILVRESDEPGIELKLEPAARVFGKVVVEGTGEPAPQQYVQLCQRTANEYYDLPEEEQLPNPADSRRSINPMTVQSTQIDDRGEFEFFTGPGAHYMYGPRTGGDAPKFDLAAGEEKEVVFEIKQVELKRNEVVKGRVTLAGSGGRAAAGARLFSYPIESFSGGHIDATADAEGRFETRQILARHLLHASATINDVKYAGLVQLGPEDEQYEVAVQPAAKLFGTLRDDQLDLPLDNRRVRCSINIEYPNGVSTDAFGGSAVTDAEGRFEIDGLIPGKVYTLTITTELGPEGRGRSFRRAGEVVAKQAGEFTQEWKLSAIDFPPVFEPIGQ